MYKPDKGLHILLEWSLPVHSISDILTRCQEIYFYVYSLQVKIVFDFLKFEVLL